MRLPGYRWLLPIGHLLIDSLVLSLWIWHSTVLLHNQKSRSANPPVVAVGFALQDDSNVRWEPRYFPPPPEFLFLLLGNPLSGIIAFTARPRLIFKLGKSFGVRSGF